MAFDTNNYSTRDLRRANRQTVLRKIYFDGPISRLDVSQQCKLSPATVTNVVVEMLKEGILIELGSEESQVGRPRTILSINKSLGYFVGIAVSETNIDIELFDVLLQPVTEKKIQLLNKNNLLEQILEKIVAGVEAILTEGHISNEKVLGIGIGILGSVQNLANHDDASTRVGKAQITPFVSSLRKKLNLPIYIENTFRAITMAEKLFGAGQDVKNFAMLYMGLGIGGGLVIDNELYLGSANSGGEWGHMTIIPNGRPCVCGSFGCLSAYAGALGIIQSVKERDPGSALIIEGDTRATIKAIVEAASQSQPVAMEVLDETIHYLGIGIANIINMVNPQQIVVSGWAGLRIAEPLYPKVLQYAERYALKEAFKTTSFSLSPLVNFTAAKGAATLALREFFFAGTRESQKGSTNGHAAEILHLAQ